MVLSGALVLLVGCHGKSDAISCASDSDCGFGAVCISGTCSSTSCATSDQCLMEQYCKSGSCVSGCQQDEDCYPGDECNTTSGSCEAATCTNGRQDCAYKQFCNTATGECYDAGGYYCHTCADDSDCGGNGNLCIDLGYTFDFCGVTCTTNDDCPNGFTCSELTDLSGNAVAYQCLTYCWLYRDGTTSRTMPPLEDLHPRRPAGARK